MSDKRYLGNIITQNPTAPAGDLANSAAKGVWSLEEQLAYDKIETILIQQDKLSWTGYLLITIYTS